MKKIFMLLVACAAMWCVSCSDDEDDNSGIGGNKGKLVSKITEVDEDGDIYTYKYEYDKQGRLIQAFQDEGYNTTYTYINNTVIEKDWENGVVHYETKYELNNEGYISQESGNSGWQGSWSEDKGDWGEMTGFYTNFYHYDSNNQLIKVSGEESYILTWNNGNLVTWESQGGSGNTWKNTFTYTPYENKTNLNIECEIGIGNLYVSKYLVEKDSFKRNGESEYDRNSTETTYKYKFDKDGYVTEINWHKKEYKANGSLEEEHTGKVIIEYFN